MASAIADEILANDLEHSAVFTVNGRWQWGSGIGHCTAIGGGCRIVADGGPGGTGFAFFEPAAVEILDTWYVAGLRGTGSTDYVVTDGFVSEDWLVSLPWQKR